MKMIAVLDRTGQQVSLAVDLNEAHVQYTARSNNSKTGDIPQQWIGATRHESLATCAMCPLYQDKTCYSQFGTPRLGHSSLLKKWWRKGFDSISLATALANRAPSAKAVRLGAIGDPGSIRKRTLRKHIRLIRTQALAALGYLHQWYLPHAAWLKGELMASCDTRTDLIEALSAGWRTTIHIDSEDTATLGVSVQQQPQGHVTLDGVSTFYTLCPAQRSGSTVTCNTCRLCDATRHPKIGIVVFQEHGVAMAQAKGRKAA